MGWVVSAFRAVVGVYLWGGFGGCRGSEGVDLRGWGDLAGGVEVLLVVVELGSLLHGATGSGEVDQVDAVELALDGRPGLGGSPFGDADQDQGQEAQRHVGPDAVLFAVVDGSDFQHLFEVAEAAFDVE